MPEWLKDFLVGIPTDLAAAIWNGFMKVSAGFITVTPQNFSKGTWSFVTETLYPWSLSIGVSVINLFFVISIYNAIKNFHENITLEMIIEALTKIVVANVLFLNVLPLIQTIYNIAALMCGEVFTLEAPKLVVEKLDMGAALFYQLFGILLIIVALVCGTIILLTIYGRYLKLYLHIITAPFAIPTLIGGRGVEHTFYAWLKTFLLNTFEIVIIALVMVISWKLIGAGLSVFKPGTLTGIVGGFWSGVNSMLTMILMTGAVKGASNYLSKTFGL